MRSALVPDIHVHDELEIWTQGKAQFYRVTYKVGLPPGASGVNDFGAIAAAGTVAKAVVNLLQLEDGYLTRMRFRPLDDLLLRLYELGGTALNYTQNLQAEVSLFTELDDPEFTLSEFFVLGSNRDIQIEVVNPRPSALARSRVKFWGERYLVEAIDKPTRSTIWLPAEGRN